MSAPGSEPEIPPADENASEDESPLAAVFSILSLAVLIVFVFAFKDFILDANNIPSGSMIPTLKVGDYLFVNKMRYSLRAPFAGVELARIDDPARGDIVTFIPPYEHDKHYVKRIMGVPGDRIRIRIKSGCEIADYLRDSSVGSSNDPAAEITRRDQPVERDYSCTDRFNQAPRVAVVEYRANDAGPWRNYGLRELSGVEARKLLVDSDDPYVLHPDYQSADTTGLARDLPVVFEETIGDKTHYIVERAAGDAVFGGALCPEISGEGCLIPPGQYLVMGDNRDDSKDSRMIGYIDREKILGKALVIYFSINWYDGICREYWNDFRTSSLEADPTEGFRLPDFPPEEQFTACSANDAESMAGGRLEYIARQIWHTLAERAPRADVRWERPATLLN